MPKPLAARPSSIVRLLTEIIEPFHGRNLDPAYGSGGIFVQSARFVATTDALSSAGGEGDAAFTQREAALTALRMAIQKLLPQ